MENDKKLKLMLDHLDTHLELMRTKIDGVLDNLHTQIVHRFWREELPMGILGIVFLIPGIVTWLLLDLPFWQEAALGWTSGYAFSSAYGYLSRAIKRYRSHMTEYRAAEKMRKEMDAELAAKLKKEPEKQEKVMN